MLYWNPSNVDSSVIAGMNELSASLMTNSGCPRTEKQFSNAL